MSFLYFESYSTNFQKHSGLKVGLGGLQQLLLDNSLQ